MLVEVGTQGRYQGDASVAERVEHEVITVVKGVAPDSHRVRVRAAIRDGGAIRISDVIAATWRWGNKAVGCDQVRGTVRQGTGARGNDGIDAQRLVRGMLSANDSHMVGCERDETERCDRQTGPQ